MPATKHVSCSPSPLPCVPMRMTLDSLAVPRLPMTMLSLSAATYEEPALYPMPMLLEPVATWYRAWNPRAVFWVPVPLVTRAAAPIAVYESPMQLKRAAPPTAVLLLLVTHTMRLPPPIAVLDTPPFRAMRQFTPRLVFDEDEPEATPELPEPPPMIVLSFMSVTLRSTVLPLAVKATEEPQLGVARKEIVAPVAEPESPSIVTMREPPPTPTHSASPELTLVKMYAVSLAWSTQIWPYW